MIDLTKRGICQKSLNFQVRSPDTNGAAWLPAIAALLFKKDALLYLCDEDDTICP